jgi:hypothetical protein
MSGKMETMLLLILILVLAAAAGILGDVLEFALWAIAVMIAFAALLGFLVYRWISGVRDRMIERR